MTLQDLLSLLQQVLPDVSTGVNEKATTTLIAKALHQANYRRFWTNPNRASDLPESTVTQGWRGLKVYDLGFAPTAAATTPEIVLNIKRANGSNPSQEPQLFLSDALAAGLEKYQKNDFVYAAFLHPGPATRRGWRTLLPLQGEIEIHLDPSSAIAGVTDDDAAAEETLVAASPTRLVPQTTSDIERIMTGGTNTRLVGAFRRAGTATFRFMVHRVESAAGTVAIYQPLHVDTEVPDLLQWWP